MFLRDFSRHNATPVMTRSPALPSAVTPAALRGLTAATLVETGAGWQTATSLRVGDQVHTLDGGLARIVALDRQVLPMGAALVHLPGGVFDACSDIMLLPHQPLLVDSRDLTEAPYCLILAGDLPGWFGAELIRTVRRTEVVTPIFADEEILWANSGLRLQCRGTRALPEFFDRADPATTRALLDHLTRQAA